MEGALILVGCAVLFVLIRVIGRIGRERRHGGSRTVALRVLADRVERVMADGRSEAVELSKVSQVEVVRTAVPTADGARAFALISESLDEEDPRGCLVPLGIGWDLALLGALSRLEAFDIRSWSYARDRPGTGREIVWRSPDLRSEPLRE